MKIAILFVVSGMRYDFPKQRQIILTMLFIGIVNEYK